MFAKLSKGYLCFLSQESQKFRAPEYHSSGMIDAIKPAMDMLKNVRNISRRNIIVSGPIMGRKIKKTMTITSSMPSGTPVRNTKITYLTTSGSRYFDRPFSYKAVG